MTSTTLRILLYALVAATSPLALAATLAVLRSTRGRINGAAFAIAFLVTQTAVCLLAFAFDAASLAASEDSHHTLVVAATISAADLPLDGELGLVVLYVLLACVLVWLPVALYIVFGTRATNWMNRAQEWVYAHEHH